MVCVYLKIKIPQEGEQPIAMMVDLQKEYKQKFIPGFLQRAVGYQINLTLFQNGFQIKTYLNMVKLTPIGRLKIYVQVYKIMRHCLHSLCHFLKI